MIITLNITEDSKVLMVRDECEAVQKESNVTVLRLNFPETIKGYSIDNYYKQIEFGECKELGECVKFYDEIKGDEYALCDTCTQFKKILIQFTLINRTDEQDIIIWKTVPVALEFCESINAENEIEIQSQLLSLEEIKNEWQNYVKSNTLRMVYRQQDMPTADENSTGDTVFYLGENVTTPQTFTYGHYYRCVGVLEGSTTSYFWQDLTSDPSLDGVANGLREINKSRTMQLWVGNDQEFEEVAKYENVMYIPEDHDIKQTFADVLTEMASDEDYNIAFPIVKTQNENLLKYGEKKILLCDILDADEAQYKIEAKQTLFSGSLAITPNDNSGFSPQFSFKIDRSKPCRFVVRFKIWDDVVGKSSDVYSEFTFDNDNFLQGNLAEQISDFAVQPLNQLPDSTPGHNFYQAGLDIYPSGADGKSNVAFSLFEYTSSGYVARSGYVLKIDRIIEI